MPTDGVRTGFRACLKEFRAFSGLFLGARNGHFGGFSEKSGGKLRPEGVSEGTKKFTERVGRRETAADFGHFSQKKGKKTNSRGDGKGGFFRGRRRKMIEARDLIEEIDSIEEIEMIEETEEVATA